MDFLWAKMRKTKKVHEVKNIQLRRTQPDTMVVSKVAMRVSRMEIAMVEMMEMCLAAMMVD